MGFCLRHFFGFLIQIVPCILLCFLPFSQEKFRLPKGKLLTGLSILLVAAAGVFVFVVYSAWEHGFEAEYSALNALANLIMGMAAALSGVVFFWTVRASVWKKSLALCLSIQYAVFIFSGVNALLPLTEDYFDVKSGIYSQHSVLLFFLFTAATLPFVCRFIRIRVQQYMEQIEEKAVRRTFFIVLGLTGIYGALLFAMQLLPGRELRILSLYLILSYLLCSLCLAVALWFLLWELQKVRQEGQYKHIVQIQHLHYQRITEDIGAIKRTRHDMRHHYRVIDSLLAEGNVSQARDYIQKLVEGIDSLEIERFCGDPLLNALLQYYVAQARQQGICCETRVSLEKCPIDGADMAVLVGNCLENAIEACLRSEEPRNIWLHIQVVNSTLAVLMENTCDQVSFARGKPAKEEGYLPAKDFLSAKGRVGGQGLSSIEQTAQKYGGIAEFRFQKPRFYTRVSLEVGEDVLTEG